MHRVVLPEPVKQREWVFQLPLPKQLVLMLKRPLVHFAVLFGGPLWAEVSHINGNCSYQVERGDPKP